MSSVPGDRRHKFGSSNTDIHFLNTRVDRQDLSEVYDYGYIGEKQIMRMFTQANSFSQTKRHTTYSAPSSLYDKSRLYRELGLTFNESGNATPNLARKRRLIYRPRRDSYSFLSGVLSQDRKLDTFVSDSLMWIESPVNGKPKPSIWFLQNLDPNALGLLAVPYGPCCSVVDRIDGLSVLSLWTCTKWILTSVQAPKDILDGLAVLKTRMKLPSKITVDCLGSHIFDVHSGYEVSDLDFTKNQTLFLTMSPVDDRPFFEVVATDIHLKPR